MIYTTGQTFGIITLFSNEVSNAVKNYIIMKYYYNFIPVMAHLNSSLQCHMILQKSL